MATLIEALKSGKRFRRKGRQAWFLCLERLSVEFPHHPLWGTEDLLAEDWEVEEQTVTITRRQLADAFYAQSARTDAHLESSPSGGDFMAKMLGFE